MNIQLRALAQRLSRLRLSTAEQATPVNFAFGALYALSQAANFGYPDDRQDGSKGRGLAMWEEVQRLASRFGESGPEQVSRVWLAGYSFNNALIRIAASFEHIVRHRTGLHDKYDPIRNEAQKQHFRDEWVTSWESVHQELNRIRHRNEEFVDGPRVSYREAVQALEHLIDALEWGLAGTGRA
jgi:hypothetical protein